MKKFIFLLLLVSKIYAQDSVKVTITPQAKDLEYISSFIFNSFEGQEFFDSCKIKFRVPSPPTGNTTVSITGYTQDWLFIFTRLKNDATAIKANCTSRIEALLRAVNQVYLTGKLDALDVADTDTFQSMRQFGRSKVRRN